uniref:Uncharacterized protein n=1 Tax=Oryza sativa subsp. japonica TaxID=39947 RepID=Q6Z1C3_ORYSJ|nr:hypothetical protein [Oryza sativa Japonica Group]
MGAGGAETAGEGPYCAGDVGEWKERGGWDSNRIPPPSERARESGRGGGVGRRRGRAARVEWGHEVERRRRRRGRLELRLQRPEVGDDRQVGPTCRHPRERREGRMGRPNKEEAERGREWADGPRRKKGRKKKKEKGLDFFWD